SDASTGPRLVNERPPWDQPPVAVGTFTRRMPDESAPAHGRNYRERFVTEVGRWRKRPSALSDIAEKQPARREDVNRPARTGARQCGAVRLPRVPVGLPGTVPAGQAPPEQGGETRTENDEGRGHATAACRRLSIARDTNPADGIGIGR